MQRMKAPQGKNFLFEYTSRCLAENFKLFRGMFRCNGSLGRQVS